MTAQQIPLALPATPSMGEDDFMITPSNHAATQFLNGNGTILLLGPKGTGKSHLANIWRQRRNATAFNTETTDISAITSAVVWEDADKGAWPAQHQERAFHLLNSAKEKTFPLLITATTAPANWPLTLNDLRSRLLAIQVAQIETPDDMLVAGLLLKHFKDRQLRISEEVLNFIIPRIARDGAAIEQLVKQLDETALANSRAITIPLVKAVLEKLQLDLI